MRTAAKILPAQRGNVRPRTLCPSLEATGVMQTFQVIVPDVVEQRDVLRQRIVNDVQHEVACEVALQHTHLEESLAVVRRD